MHQLRILRSNRLLAGPLGTILLTGVTKCFSLTNANYSATITTRTWISLYTLHRAPFPASRLRRSLFLVDCALNAAYDLLSTAATPLLPMSISNSGITRCLMVRTPENGLAQTWNLRRCGRNLLLTGKELWYET